MNAPHPVLLQINPLTRITYDINQWIIQTRKTTESDWKSRQFVGSTMRVVRRVLDEMGVRVPKKIERALPASPVAFLEWYNARHPSP